MAEKQKVTIGFANGKEIEFYCDSITIKRNNITGEIVSYKIESLGGNVCPLYIRIPDIVYITTTEQEG
jgi:hypothetical protein